jgi:hypothetical protein
VNSDDAVCGPLDQLRSSIRKRDKRIDGFGHEQFLQIRAWPRYGTPAWLLRLATWPGRSLGKTSVARRHRAHQARSACSPYVASPIAGTHLARRLLAVRSDET